MENGDALSYINSTDEIIDRMKLLMDVQSGVEYLHSRGIVHGDLRAVCFKILLHRFSLFIHH